MSKINPGNYFEDFEIGQFLRHATPRTVTLGDAALYMALFGPRFAMTSSDEFGRSLGLPGAPIDDLLAFHIVFGKTVPDISLNAVANLGYADCRFLTPVYAGDTLSTSSEVIGLRELSNGQSGIVYVRSTGVNQRHEVVIEYVRWVMVRKRDKAAAARAAVIPELPEAVAARNLAVPAGLDFSNYNCEQAGSPHLWDDYRTGEKIDHVDGMTIEEAEHMMATRLYQNTAKVHFNQYMQNSDKAQRRLVYGGHVISLARALSFNGLANGVKIAAINAGRHVAPCYAGHTIFAWSEILEKAEIPGRKDVGALRVRLFATKDHPCADFPGVTEGGHDPAVILDLDYWLLMGRR
ncbi:MAG: 2-methylfumaryl-CoA hydratase [Alphaproteobacteria bacterium]|nr:2-methylfumaryl-CoA hydratase [Alphaproteobacteria bacterium]